MEGDRTKAIEMHRPSAWASYYGPEQAAKTLAGKRMTAKLREEREEKDPPAAKEHFRGCKGCGKPTVNRGRRCRSCLEDGR